MLALLERCVTDLGGSYVFCDTDSMAIVATETGGPVACPGGAHRLPNGKAAVQALSRHQVEAIVERFGALSLYDRAILPGSILKVEDVNSLNGKWRQLYAYAISAKRYVLFNRSRNGRRVLRKVSEHGLGHLLNPIAPDEAERFEEGPEDGERWPRWIGDTWRWILAQALGERCPRLAWFDRPAVSRLALTSPELLGTFAQLNADRSYAKSLKPMGFGLSIRVKREALPIGVEAKRFQLVAQFSKDPREWLEQWWIEKYSGRRYRIGVGHDARGHRIRVRAVGEEIERFAVHPEPKSLGPDGVRCWEGTVGLLRRRAVQLDCWVYVGKESNRVEEVERGLVTDLDDVRTVYGGPDTSPWRSVAVPLLRTIPVARIARTAGVSHRQAKYYRAGTKVPGGRRMRALLTLLERHAKPVLSERQSPPELRTAAESFLQRLASGGDADAKGGVIDDALRWGH